MGSCLDVGLNCDKVPIVTQNFVRTQLLSNYSKSCQNFFLHLYGSREFHHNDNPWVPIPDKYIRENFRTFLNKKEKRELSNSDIIIVKKYDRQNEKCSEYCVNQKALYQITNDLLANAICGCESTKLSPVPKKYSAMELNHYGKHSKYTCKLAQDAAKLIRCTMNFDQALIAVTNQFELGIKSKYWHDVKKSHSDLRNIMMIRRKAGKDFGEISYNPKYKIGSTGRIFEMGGGIQNLSGRIKQEVFGNSDEFRNYDIKSSQIAALAQECDKVGIDSKVLHEYISDKSAKVRYAEEIGISVDAWKSCILSIIFGANANSLFGNPFQVIKETHPGDEHRLYRKFIEVSKPIRDVIDEWIRLLPKYVDERSYPRSSKKFVKKFLRNAAGNRISLETDQSLDKKYISSFILQGLESAYIHHLTILSKDYGFEVVSNEHDGLIVIGRIPEEAMSKARELSGFRLAELVEKDFVADYDK